MSGARTRTAGCLCGAVRLTATVAHPEFSACHCTMCRRWSAGPFLSVECESMTVEGGAQLGVYRSSAWAERGFCKACGSVLFYRLVGKPLCAVSLEAFDDKQGLAFTSQIFIDEKPDYYDFANATKTMTGSKAFAAYAAAEARREQAKPG